jgi:hypothetical protein
MAFQQELASLYQPIKRGQPPIAPAQLALATIVQAYTGASDDEVIEATQMDRRLLERLRLLTKARHLGRARYALRWIAVRYGELDALRIPTTSWDMHSKRSCR